MKQLGRRVTARLRRVLGTDGLQSQPGEFDMMADRVLASSAPSKLSQLLLIARYQELAQSGGALPKFSEVEFRAFSQNGEDGILLYLFGLLGWGQRRVVEICAGDGLECNAANLIINHGWNALLFDGDADHIERGLQFYQSHPDTRAFPPRMVHAWLTRDNVNQLLQVHGFEGEVDLLSLDLDGIDYWIWEALEVIRPRVVVAEIQCIWGSDKAVTVPYDPEFRAEYVQGFGIYSGASLAAFIKLAARKGYRFVGVQRLGFNAFFIRNGLADDFFPAADPAISLDVPFVRWAQRELLPLVANKPWVPV